MSMGIRAILSFFEENKLGVFPKEAVRYAASNQLPVNVLRAALAAFFLAFFPMFTTSAHAVDVSCPIVPQSSGANATEGTPPLCSTSRTEYNMPGANGFYYFYEGTADIFMRYKVNGDEFAPSFTCAGRDCSVNSGNNGRLVCGANFDGICNISFSYANAQTETVNVSFTVRRNAPAQIDAATHTFPDAPGPTLTITGVPPLTRLPFTATFTFSEPVNGFSLADNDITVSGGGAASNLTGSDGDSVYTALITPSAQGAFQVGVAAGAATADTPMAAANVAAVAGGTYDTVPPTIEDIRRSRSDTTSTPDPVVNPVNMYRWIVIFDENVLVADVDSANFSVSGLTGATLTVTPIGVGSQYSRQYHAVVTGGNIATYEGDITLSLSLPSTISDEAGNELVSTAPTGAINQPTVTLDHIDPVIVLGPASANANFTATIQINDATTLTGLNPADVSITNATKDLLSFQGGPGALYHQDVTTLTGSDMVLTIAAGAVTDGAGNTNAQTQRTIAFNDTTAPEVSSIVRTTPATSPTNADSLLWTVTFNEPVQNVSFGDFTLNGGAINSGVTLRPVSTSVYEVGFTTGDLTNFDGTVTLSFTGGQDITDRAATPNALVDTTPTGANENTYELDNTDPTVTSFARETPAASPTNADSLIWRVTFSEDVFDVAAADFDVAGTTATVTNVTGVGDIYFVTVSGGDLATLEGTVTLSFAGGATITDEVGNDFTPSTPGTNTFDVTNTGPIPTITPSVTVTNGVNFTVTLNFGANVQTLTEGEISVVNGSVVGGSLTPGGGVGSSFTATIDPDDAGDISISLLADVADDDVGNGNAAAGPAVVTLDAARPGVVITPLPANTSAPFIATFTFDEPVNGFTIGHITLPAGVTASAFTGVDGDTVYTALITPGADGAVTIDVAENVAQDSGGNGNTAAIQVGTVFDGTAPSVTFINAPASVTGTAAFTVTVQFSEPVTGFDPSLAADVVVTNGTNSSSTVIDPSNYTVTVTPSGSGDITIAIPAAAGVDVSGNPNIQGSVVVKGTIVQETQEMIARFMFDRANQILSNQVGLTGFLSGGGIPGSFNLEGTLDSQTLSFGASLSPSQQSVGGPAFWVSGAGSRTKTDEVDTEFLMLTLGGHMALPNDNILVGALVQFDHAVQKEGVEEIDGRGWMVGPYIVGRIPERDVFYEFRVAYGQSENDITPFGTYTDTFDTERFMARAAIDGIYEIDEAWSVRPNASFSYFAENQLQYFDTLGNLIPKQKAALGQAQFGPEIRYKHLLDVGGSIETSLGLSGISNFGVENDTGYQGVIEDGFTRGRVDLGILYQNDQNARVKFGGYYDGIGAQDFYSYGGDLTFIWTF
jgi:hypothetical protein